MAKTVASRKSKGRRLQNLIVERLYKKYSNLEDGDIKPAIMGESGKDIKLSPAAKKIIPFDIEAKNQEKLQLWQMIKQAEDNSEDDRIPLVVFKRNHSKVYAILEFDKLLELLK